ncbi:hypothetical protein ACFE04_006459 [Oxalis oulophora]
MTQKLKSPPTTTNPLPPSSRLKPKEPPPKHEAFHRNGTNDNGVTSSSPKTKTYKSLPQQGISKTMNRSLVLLSKPKSRQEESQKGNRVVVVVERQSPPANAIKKKENEKKKINSNSNININNNLIIIKDLQSQVLTLRAELDKAHTLNNKLTHDLADAHIQLQAFTTNQQQPVEQDYHTPKFKDIQKLIANKLESPKGNKLVIHTIKQPLAPPPLPPKCSPPAGPPPPPPPLPPRPIAKTRTTTPSLVQFYHLLTNQENKKNLSGHGNHTRSVLPSSSAHNSIVGEIQNRSAHLLAIKSDIETKGEFINGLIRKVLDAAYMDIQDVDKFIGWLDSQLSSLADERAVLKKFNWPERKADAMREAAIEYRELKLLEKEISSYTDDRNIPCGTALKKMASLLDKSEKSTQRLIKLRNSVMRSYQDFKIPVDWMLDSGIMNKIKRGSVKLAKVYMERVRMELELVRNSDRESTQEALLLQGVHFAYRAHQFAGGLDSETLCAFDEIRQRIPGHIGTCGQLLVGIPST